MPSRKKDNSDAENYLDSLSLLSDMVRNKVDEYKEKSGTTPVSILFEILTNLSMDKTESSKVWKSVNEHKSLLCKQLNRDVDIRLAMLDYLMSVENKLKNPKFIEIEIFEEILKASKEDPKTGLYNSKHFMEMLNNELNKANRNHFPLSILFIDIDNFKECNDVYGHTIGDEYLLILARVLKKMVRGEDIAGRFGGDEFIIMLSHVEKNEAFFIADRIVSMFKKEAAKNKELKSCTKNITLSVGISSFPDDAETAEKIVKSADKALYEAKRDGKDRVAYYQEEKARLEMSENRRKAFRYGCFGKEIIFNITNSKYKYKGFLQNISEDGIQIEIPNVTVLLKGLPVKIEIEENKLNPFNISGEILYARKQESSLFAGLIFDEKNKEKEKENLKKFIKVQKCREIDH